jgi:hypothetical protein
MSNDKMLNHLSIARIPTPTGEDTGKWTSNCGGGSTEVD